MSKRYIDTDRWKKRKFLQLSAKAKVFYMYIWDNCDHAGVWNVNFDLAEYQIKEKFNHDDIKNELIELIVVLEKGNKWFLPEFIEISYNNKLRSEVKCQKSVLQILNQHEEIKNKVDDYFFGRELPFENQ
jgi:hypothetical protein